MPGPDDSLALSLQRISSRDGLPHNSIFAIHQDHRGFLWIGTADGLGRYDGYEFVTYRSVAGDSTSLASNMVRSILEDETGHLWIGTDSGLSRFEPSTDQFTSYFPPAYHDANFIVETIALDESGRLWIRTQRGGLYKFDSASGQFKAYETEGETTKRLGATLSRTPSGEIWTSTVTALPGAEMKVSLLRYNADFDSFEPSVYLGRHPRDSYLPQLYAAKSGLLWVGLEDSQGRLETSHQLRLLPELPKKTSVHSIVQSKEGTVWIGTSEGLYLFGEDRSQLRRHAVDTSRTAWLSNNVQTLFEDRSGNVWIGTLSGLYHFDPHRKPFGHLGPGSGLPTDRGAHSVTAIYEDEQGMLWLGTIGGGLLKLDRSTKGPTRYRHVRGEPTSLPSDLIWDLEVDDDGNLWLAAGKLCAFDRSAARCTTYDIPALSITKGKDHTLWVNSYSAIWHFDISTRRVLRRMSKDELGGTIQSVFAAENGNLWVSTESGLVEYDPITGSIRVISEPLPVILDIYEDSDGLLWLGTRNGLARYDPATEDVGRFLEAESPGFNFYSIEEDRRGHLWIGTNNGLARFHKTTRAFTYFDASDGIASVEFNRRASFHSIRGELFFGGLDGVTFFTPDRITENDVIPPIAITRASRFNRRGEIHLKPIAGKPFAIEPGDAAFDFEFASLSFTNPSKNQYAYRLEGFDEDWVQAGTRRYARYTNVPPGSYVFRAKGSNDDGIWNEKGAAIQVTVLPAYWQTWWFRLVMIVAVIGLLTAGYRYRVEQLLREERLRLRIAGDLHDDVGSKLSSIALMGEMLRDRAPLSEEDRSELDRMCNAARETVDELRDIVWFVDPKDDLPDALKTKMERVADVMLNGISYSLDWPEDVRSPNLGMEGRRNLLLLYKEALHNVAEHAAANAVEICVRRDGSGFRLMIRDDGCGFEPSGEAAGHGLGSMRRRAEALNGDLTIHSRTSVGTHVELLLRE